jgi:hypothetical protein
MRRQRHETAFPAPITAIFPLLLGVLARGRWADSALLGSIGPAPSLPGIGAEYAQQRGSVYRSGRVLECLRPVAVTLEETLLDPPCRVRLILRWRLEPVDTGALVRLEARYALRGAAPLRRRHWDGRIKAHCERMLAALANAVAAAATQAQPVAGTSGQMKGSSSITVTNTTSVSGTPTLR